MLKAFVVVMIWTICGALSAFAHTDDPLLGAMIGTVIVAFIDFNEE